MFEQGDMMNKRHKWNTADTVTSVRIACSFVLLKLPMSSPEFILIYTLVGLTDVLDGWLARKTGTASDFGAKLDSIADLLFYGMLLFRLLPVLWLSLPAAVWYVVSAVLLVRVLAYTTAAVKYHRFASLHTWHNKLTGGAVFLLPYMFAVSDGVAYGWAVCLLALAASLEELTIHLFQKEYSADRKTLFHRAGA